MWLAKKIKNFPYWAIFNQKLLNEGTERSWGNFTTSLGLSQLVCEPTRVTKDSATLIDHIYTNNEESIQHVNVIKVKR